MKKDDCNQSKKYKNILGKLEATKWIIKMNISVVLPLLVSALALPALIFEKIVGKRENTFFVIITIVSITISIISLIVNLSLSLHKQSRVRIRNYNAQEINGVIRDDLALSKSNYLRIGNSILYFDNKINMYILDKCKQIKFKYLPNKTYYPPYECRENALAVFKDIFDSSKHFRDNKKIKMITNLESIMDNDSNEVLLSKTTYFNSTITNEIAFKQITSEKKLSYLFDGKKLLYNAQGKLCSLEESLCSNHIGVSTLLVTNDNKVVIVKQGNKNNIDSFKYIVSGSGSMDLSDKKHIKDNSFNKLIVYAMERELREECNLNNKICLRTTVIGYGRILNRGGKPEFFGVTLSPNLSSKKAVELIRAGKEIRQQYMTDEVHCFNINCKTVQEIRKTIGNENISIQLFYYLENLFNSVKRVVNDYYSKE